MNTEIPKTIKIGALVYEVIFIEDRNFEHAKVNSASCNTVYQKIWLEYGKRKSDGMTDDLVHEIMEAINGQCDLALNHQTITTIATMFHQVFKDNKLNLFGGD